MGTVIFREKMRLCKEVRMTTGKLAGATRGSQPPTSCTSYLPTNGPASCLSLIPSFKELLYSSYSTLEMPLLIICHLLTQTFVSPFLPSFYTKATAQLRPSYDLHHR